MKLTDLTDKQSLEALPKKEESEQKGYYCHDNYPCLQCNTEGKNKTIDQYNQLEFGGDVEKLASIITDIRNHELCDLNIGSVYIAKQIINSMPHWITVRKGDV